MGVLDILNIAFRNIRYQRIRSYLTLIGIIIGIAAIVALVSIGQGLSDSVTSSFEKLGMDVIFVEPGSQTGITTAFARTIRESDIDIIENIPGVEQVMPFYEHPSLAIVGSEQESVFLIGVEIEDIPYLVQSGFIDIGEGRNLVSGDRYSLVVPGTFVEEAFDEELKLRQRVKIEGKSFKIIGITQSSDVFFSGFGLINMGWVPADTLKEVADVTDPVELAVKVYDRELVPEVEAEIKERLERDHEEVDFSVLTTEGILVSAGIVLTLIQLVLVGIASISLVVGGIGIMNTMVMAVMERTREIGVMKAVGATDRQVQGIFIAEAGLFGMVGGIIGAAVGLGAAFLVSSFADSAGFPLPIDPDPFVIGGAIFFALVVGIISGIYPARRAAKLDPVEALRYE